MKINSCYSNSHFRQTSSQDVEKSKKSDKTINVLEDISTYSFLPALFMYGSPQMPIKTLAGIGIASDLAYIALNSINAKKEKEATTKSLAISNIFKGISFATIHTGIITTSMKASQKNRVINTGLLATLLCSIGTSEYFKFQASKKASSKISSKNESLDIKG